MTSENETEAREKKRRIPIALCGIFGIALLLAFILGDAFFRKAGFYIAMRMFPLFLGWTIFLIGLLLGDTILSLFRIHFSRRRYYYFTAQALGLGIVGHLALLLGLMHLLIPSVLLLIFGMILILRIRALTNITREVFLWLKRIAHSPYRFIHVAAFILLCVSLTPYFTISFVPALDYDVLEYHLAVPLEYAREGSIHALPYNFFSNLPFEVEMLYTVGLLIGGSVGIAVPKFVSFWLLIASCIGVYLLVQRCGGELGWRLLAVILFLAHPIVTTIGFDTFAGMGTVVFTLAALLVFIEWRTQSASSFFVLVSVFLGFALCTKYSAAGVVIIPFFLIFFTSSAWKDSTSLSGRGAAFFKHCALSSFMVIAVFSLWVLKNVIFTGNPVFPFLSSIFPSPIWSEVQSQLLHRAHPLFNPMSLEYLAHAVRNVSRLEPVYVVLLLLGVFYRGKSIYIRPFIIFILAGYIVWSLGGSFPDRFLIPLVPFVVMVCVLTLREYCSVGKGAHILTALLIISLISPLFDTYRRVAANEVLDLQLGVITEETFLEKNLEEVGAVINAANSVCDRNDRLLLLYEARSALFHCRTLSNTVFDESPLLEWAKEADSGETLYDKVKEKGFSYCFVNENELHRLIAFYADPGAVASMEIDIDNPHETTRHPQLYPPYFRDSDYMHHRHKIEAFLTLLRERIIVGYPDDKDAAYVYLARLD